MISYSKARKDAYQLFVDCANEIDVKVFDCIPNTNVSKGAIFEIRYTGTPITPIDGISTQLNVLQCTLTVFSFESWEVTEQICDQLATLSGKGDKNTFQMIILKSNYYMDFIEAEGFFAIQMDFDIILRQ